MAGQERLLPIESVAKRLGFLEQSGRVVTWIGEHRSEIEPLIFKGFNELIDRFNRLRRSDASKLAPILGTGKVWELKGVLGGSPLPRLEEIGAKEVLLGVNESRSLMAYGQEVGKGVVADTSGDKKRAILAPNLQTSEKALAVGIAGHLIERSIFWYFEKKGLTHHQWEKDDILCALEEMAMLMEAEYRIGKGPEPRLLKIFATPPSADENGGLGWRKPEEVDEFVRKYQMLTGAVAKRGVKPGF